MSRVNDFIHVFSHKISDFDAIDVLFNRQFSYSQSCLLQNDGGVLTYCTYSDPSIKLLRIIHFLDPPGQILK